MYTHTHIYTPTLTYTRARMRKQRAEIRAISGRLPWLQAIKAGLLGGLSAIHADRYHLNTGIEP